MFKRLMFAVSAVALSITLSSAAQAQGHFGVSAGLSVPLSPMSDAVKSGYNLTGMLQYSMPLSPVGIRAELGYNHFDIKDGGGTARILDGAANVIISVPSASSIKPYVTAGLGAYNTKLSFDNSLGGLFGQSSASQTKLGFNGGIGMSFGLTGFQTQVEARYVYITANSDDDPTKYVPISFGIMF